MRAHGFWRGSVRVAGIAGRPTTSESGRLNTVAVRDPSARGSGALDRQIRSRQSPPLQTGGSRADLEPLGDFSPLLCCRRHRLAHLAQ